MTCAGVLAKRAPRRVAIAASAAWLAWGAASSATGQDAVAPASSPPAAAETDGEAAAERQSADAPPPTRYFDLGEIRVQEFRPTRNETAEVRFSIQLRLKPEVTAVQAAALEHWKHRLRDQAIIAARLASSADLAEPGLDRLQASILRRMKRILPTLAVERLYFTDFAAGTP